MQTVQVTCLIKNQDGSPVEGAKIEAKLSLVDINVDDGYILPLVVNGTSGIDGRAILELWPNQLGSTQTKYNVKITHPISGKTQKIYATIPNANCFLHLVADLPEYDGKSDGQLAIDAAVASVTNSAIASAVSAVDSATSAQNSLDSKNAAVSAKVGAEAALVNTIISKDAAKISEDNSFAFAVSAEAYKDLANASALIAITKESESSAAAASSASSASTATIQATNAAESAITATSQAINASASSVAAATSATNAASSASTAATQASTATTQASNASTSANAALISSSSATASAAAASTSAINAANSENNSAANAAAGTVVDYTALRAYTGGLTALRVSGYTASGAPLGIAGLFTVDITDTTSADNGGTIIVASSGKRWKRVYDGDINALWFGAKGGGVTNDTSAIQASIDFCILNKRKLFVPSGTYKITTSITNTSAGTIDIECEEGALFDGSTSTSAYLFTLGGSVAGAISINADVSKGSLVLNIPSSGLVEGDIFKIQSTDLWNPTRAYYYKGEICRVRSVSGSSVTIDSPLYDSYLSATTSIYKYSMADCSINNLKITRAGGNNGLAGLFLQHIKDFSLTDCSFNYCTERGLYIKESISGRVQNCSTYSRYVASGLSSGTCYGLILDSTQNITVSGGNYVAGRHGISMGGTIPFRNIVVENVTVNNDTSTTPCLDTHGNGEFVHFNNCHAMNGIGSQAINTIISGGEYYAKSYTAASVLIIPEINSDYFIIENITAISYVGRSCVAIVPYTSNNITINKVTIENVYATAYGAGSSYVSVFHLNPSILTNSCTYNKVSYINCTVDYKQDPNVLAYGFGIGVGCNNVTANIYLKNCSVLTTYTEASTKPKPFYFNLSGDVESNNSTYSGASADYHCILAGSVNFYSNRDVFNGLGTASYMHLNTTGKVKITNSEIKNFTVLNGLSIPLSTNVQLTDVTFSGSSGSINIPLTHPYSFLTHTGNKVLYRNAIPTLGTWVVGDIIKNTSPTASSVKEWVCTTAGSVGTWTANNLIAPNTVASLPSASTSGAGYRAFVSDSTITTFGTTVTGGGANNVPVYSDGTNWKVG